MGAFDKDLLVRVLVGLMIPAGCSLAVDSELDGKPSRDSKDASAPSDASDASDADVLPPVDAADGDALDANACVGCTPEACCNGACTLLDTDPAHCGACDRPCPAARSCSQGICSGGWVPMGANASLTRRLRACAVWTGEAMFVWGGVDENDTALDTGDLYDPITDTWKPVALTDAPSPRDMPTCLAAGTLVFVWGGRDPTAGLPLDDGAMYNPSSDSWEPIPAEPEQRGRLSPSAVWTGSRALIWGGEDEAGKQSATGGMFDPTAGTWTAMASEGAPLFNRYGAEVWTGGTMLTFGGRDDSDDKVEQSLLAFAPVPNLWSAEANPLPPLARSHAFGAWTGSTFLLWGGLNAVKWALGDGGQYNPTTKTWTTLTAETASGARARIPFETGWSAWTGSTLVIMGGTDGLGSVYEDGLILDPAAPIGSRWTDIPPWSPGGSHEQGVGVWTGEEFILWGGTDGSVPTVDGSRWMP